MKSANTPAMAEPIDSPYLLGSSDRRSLEIETARILEPLWDRAGMAPHYPATADEVINLLWAAGYEVTDKTISDFVEIGYILPPPRVAGRMVWSPAIIAEFIGSLEHRRRWQKCSPLHSWKRSAFERDQDLAELHAEPDIIARSTLEDLLGLILIADRPESRQALYAALRIKLRNQL